MKTLITIFISILFISICFAQQDLLPAFPREIIYRGEIAYFNDSPFTGLLVDEKSNKKMGEYLNGYKNGMFTEYYDNGKKKTEGKYINGVKEGIYTEWFSNGQQKLSYTFNSGKISDGKYSIYLENGQLEKEEIYFKGIVTNEAYYENNQIVKSKNQIIEYHPNGEMKSLGYTTNEKKDGLWTRWFDTGKKEEEVNYENGILNGKYSTWYENDQMRSEGEYINGELNGVWTYWYADGKVKSEENYKDGKKDEKFVKKNRNKKTNESIKSKMAEPGKK